MRPNKNTKYDTIKIPEGLTQKIDELLKVDKSFTSRTDVIKYAVRLLYREFGVNWNGNRGASLKFWKK